jgi:hypothetical protein
MSLLSESASARQLPACLALVALLHPTRTCHVSKVIAYSTSRMEDRIIAVNHDIY